MLYKRKMTVRMHTLLDMGFGTCRLRDPGVRSIVEEALLFFDGDRYHLDSFVIMPNHAHVLVSMTGEQGLRTIMHSWKSYTSNAINKFICRQGAFWLGESWDHLVRNEEYLQKYRRYIFNNPVKAGLRLDEYTLWP